MKVYMSNWFTPPCHDYNDGMVQYWYTATDEEPDWPRLSIQEPADQANRSLYVLESAIVPDKAFFIDQNTLLDCSIQGDGNPMYSNRITFRSNMYMYCLDTANLLLPAMRHTILERSLQENVESEKKSNSFGSGVPFILQYGDLKHSHEYRFMNLPHFKKFRSAAASSGAVAKVANGNECYSTSRETLDAFHGDDDNNPVLQPIIWKLASRRHFRFLDLVLEEDISWTDKKNMAVFSGQLTGSRDGFQKDVSDEENCLRLRRCRLVYTHANSTLVYAKLTHTRGRLPNVLNGVELVIDSVSIGELLKFKGIIMLEGNDVASGLKWSLLSQSVVLMPPPRHTSWAMEELLEPWIHYIPLSDDLHDVEEKMQWVVDNDELAQRIAERGSFWMQDLVYHPDAAEDDQLVQEEIVRRYVQHFREVSR